MSNSGYSVTILRSAQKEIRALDAGVRERVVAAIRTLTVDPRPHGCRKLVGAENRWRVRVGEYRVIYSVDDAGRVVKVIAARHRSRAYE